MKKINFILYLLSAVLYAQAAPTFVDYDNNGGVRLADKDYPAVITFDANDFPGVKIAIESLQKDFEAVTGIQAQTHADGHIVIGTLGKSKAIDRYVKRGIIKQSDLKGKYEKFVIKTVDDKLVIAGSDKRGTIYGIYELARQIGVSPWYYWADAPIAKHNVIYARHGEYTDGEPAVKYRGIFLNDEAPCLTTWVKNTFGTNYGDHRFYAKVFELILRLKGNMLWPAMWGWAFYADDSLNSKTADEMGIVIGTSHHEPMARNHQEWARNRKNYGAWNYRTNKTVIDKFFREGIERAKHTDDIITIGMRGDGDEAMSDEADTRLLKDIVKNQRKIIADVTGRPASQTPQVWALYKEVLEYYDKGMRVPEDVTLMLCDDNWGNVRRVPSVAERNRKGGWGLYYHVDYVGAPRNSKWLNVTPIQNMWEQLQLAYTHGIDRIWILNVGDLKPMEYPISLYFDMAWHPNRYSAANITDHAVSFCRELFGDHQADEVARILNLLCKYNGRITAEMLDANTYNIETGEWKQVTDEYLKLEAEALRQYITLPPTHRDAYQQIILFPLQAMANIYEMYYAQAMNHKLYKLNNPDANIWADRVADAFRRDSLLCAGYNKEIAGGKWDGMMIQKHIGYKSWNDDFPKDVMPKVFRVANTQPGGYVFTAKDSVVAMEAEHYHTATDAAETQWTVIPHMGRTRSGLTLMPYDKPTDGALLTYKFSLNGIKTNTVKVHIVVKSTLDYLNKGSLTYTVSLNGGQPKEVRFNENLNEKKENIYSIYYPTVARRVVESVIELPIGSSAQDLHTLVIRPNDPAIVFEKIVVDCGGYRPSYLFMNESPCRR